LLRIAAAARARGDVKHPEAIGALHEGISPDKIHQAIARALHDADRAAIILGPTALNHPSAAYLRGVAAALAKMSGAGLGFLAEGANAAGAWLAGAVPHRDPAKASLDTPGAHAAAMLEDPLDAYVLLGVEPERDCGNPAAARRALGAANFVVSLTAYRTDAMDEYADALLPIAGFAETSGTYVNMEGTWQSFEGALPAPGGSRPAWKVLRVLGNLLELDGFDQVASTEVRDELRGLTGEPGPEQSPWPLPSSTPDKLDGTERVGDVPIYAVDPVVRRATALQRTRDAALAGAAVSASFAEALGLKEGDKVALSQNGHAATALLAIDPSVPDGCVRVPSGLPASEALGPAFGPMEISKA
jgi:NADH-quinone oxidoreductase subunit G